MRAYCTNGDCANDARPVIQNATKDVAYGIQNLLNAFFMDQNAQQTVDAAFMDA